MIPELGLILDAGTGMYRCRDLIETRELKILLSHAHLDHCLGITFLFDVLHERNVDRVQVFAEVDKIAAIQEHLFATDLFPVMPEIEFVPLPETVFTVDGVGIESFPLRHPGGSVGYKLTKGEHSLAYVTDTTATSDAPYLEHIRDVETLIHECYFPDGFEDRAELTGHSCLSPVCKIAREARAGRLYLVHINPLDEKGSQLDLESARQIFEHTLVAEDYQVIDVLD